MKKESMRKLVEQNIQWYQKYTEKTEFLKRQFEDVIGPGSYFRFEGDAPDGDRYYCIIGPAKVHHPRAKFFAGVRKLPATYSAGGKYFDSMDGAAAYARETWGVPTPKELKPYTSGQLHDISEKVSRWKKENEEKSQDRNDKEEKTSMSNRFNMRQLREALAKPRVYMGALEWISIEEAEAGTNEMWNNLLDKSKSYLNALVFCKEERFDYMKKFMVRYGLTAKEASYLVHGFLGYNPEISAGVYAILIGPYYTNDAKKDSFVQYYKNYCAQRANERGEEFTFTGVSTILVNEILADPNVPKKMKTYALRWQQDNDNIFAFYSRRFQERDFEKVKELAADFMASNLKQFLGIIDESDLQVKCNVPTGEKHENGSYAYETVIVDGIDPTNPGPLHGEIPGKGDRISLSLKGSWKILQSIASQEYRRVPMAFAQVMSSNPGIKDAGNLQTFLSESISAVSAPPPVHDETTYPEVPGIPDIIVKMYVDGPLQKPSVIEYWFTRVKQEIQQAGNAQEYLTQQEHIIQNSSWSDVIDEVLQDQATQHASGRADRQKIQEALPELELELIMSNKTYYGKFLAAVQKKQQELIDAGDTRALFMQPIDEKWLKPDEKNTSAHFAGQLFWDSLNPRPINESMANLKVEILREIVESGTDDVETITKALNEKGVRVQLCTGKKIAPSFSPSAIQWWIEKFPSEMTVSDANGKIIVQLTYEQLLDIATRDYALIREYKKYGVGCGAGSLQGAIDVASIYYAGTLYDDTRDIDPLTRARFDFSNIAPIITLPQGNPDVSSVQLRNLRDTSTERVAPDTDLSGLTEAEIEKQIGPEVQPENAVIQPNEVVETPEQDFDITQLPQETEETGKPEEQQVSDNQEEPEKPQIALEDIMFGGTDFNSTLRRMIKMAKDLDDDNKFSQAEEIHKIIRKYANKMRKK